MLHVNYKSNLYVIRCDVTLNCLDLELRAINLAENWLIKRKQRLDFGKHFISTPKHFRSLKAQLTYMAWNLK